MPYLSTYVKSTERVIGSMKTCFHIRDGSIKGSIINGTNKSIAAATFESFVAAATAAEVKVKKMALPLNLRKMNASPEMLLREAAWMKLKVEACLAIEPLPVWLFC
jgi:hypothetical protein